MKDWLIGGAISVVLMAAALAVFSPESLDRPMPLRVYIDSDTGCQFLGRGGAVIPRLDASGEQLGCRHE